MIHLQYLILLFWNDISGQNEFLWILKNKITEKIILIYIVECLEPILLIYFLFITLLFFIKIRGF